MLEPREAVHGDGTLREIALEKRWPGRFMRDSRITGHRGSTGGDVTITPMQQGIDGIERRDSAPRIVLAQGKRSRQHTQFPKLRRRPLDAPPRRKAPIRELRNVPLQTDR